MKDRTVAKPQSSKSGSAHQAAPAPTQASKTATQGSNDKGAWTTIDTAGMTPGEIAALAEKTLSERKQKRNTNSSQKRKMPEIVEKHPATVKSKKEEAETPAADAKAPAQKGGEVEQPAPPAPVGRPSMFTDALGDVICERLADGESLSSICRDEKMPARTTVFRWIDAHEQFGRNYARAREAFIESLVDDTLPIADDGRNDTYTDEDGNQRTDHDVIARSKLRIDTRKWLAAKMLPKRYGDKLDLNHGGQAGNPIETRTKVVLVPAKTPAEVETKPIPKGNE